MMGQNFQLLSLEWTSPMRRLLFTNLPKLAPLASNYDYSLKFGARLLEDVLRYRVFNSNQLILSWKYFCNPTKTMAYFRRSTYSISYF